MPDAIAEFPGHISGVVSERLGRITRLPAAFVLEGLRQVPVIERGERRDARLQQLIDQTVVEVETSRVWRARALREDARPGDGEAVRVRTDRPHQRHVLLVPMVVIVGDIAGVVVLDVARLMRVGVPNRRTLAVLIPGAFDLVRRRSGAPVKTFRERVILHARPPAQITAWSRNAVGLGSQRYGLFKENANSRIEPDQRRHRSCRSVSRSGRCSNEPGGEFSLNGRADRERRASVRRRGCARGLSPVGPARWPGPSRIRRCPRPEAPRHHLKPRLDILRPPASPP